jgi:hypothetical protein
VTAYGRNFGRSRTSCESECTRQSPNRGSGCVKLLKVSLPTMPFPRTMTRSAHSADASRSFGSARFSDAANAPTSRGHACKGWPTTGSRNRRSFTHGQVCALPSGTQGKNRMRESRPSGSVRGAVSNHRPYRDLEPRAPRHEIHQLGEQRLAAPPGNGSRSCAWTFKSTPRIRGRNSIRNKALNLSTTK